MSEYQIINGTAYKAETNKEIIEILENIRINKIRIVVDYGDTKTGKSWGEVNDITGYIGRSTGEIKIPLLIYNKKSLCGDGLLDNCIVKIETSKGKNILYQHKNYSK